MRINKIVSGLAIAGLLLASAGTALAQTTTTGSTGTTNTTGTYTGTTSTGSTGSTGVSNTSTTGSTATTPGVPNTGAGGDATTNMLILGTSAVIAAGGAAYLARQRNAVTR